MLKSIVGIYSFLNNEKIVGHGVNVLLDLENKLVEESNKFYQTRAKKMIQDASLVDYLILADNLFRKEITRLETCLTW